MRSRVDSAGGAFSAESPGRHDHGQAANVVVTW